ncbi:uncharacterized protein [Ptychodera flava]|uniref:uncharacterized protein n=1 Tax=Ptychodera flava TaxID=63121 RepID=UPI00396A6F7A
MPWSYQMLMPSQGVVILKILEIILQKPTALEKESFEDREYADSTSESEVEDGSSLQVEGCIPCASSAEPDISPFTSEAFPQKDAGIEKERWEDSDISEAMDFNF